jgi:hypothetical protein
MRSGKDLLTDVLYRLIEDGEVCWRSNWNGYQYDWEVNHAARMCVSNILKNWNRKAA